MFIPLMLSPIYNNFYDLVFRFGFDWWTSNQSRSIYIMSRSSSIRNSSKIWSISTKTKIRTISNEFNWTSKIVRFWATSRTTRQWTKIFFNGANVKFINTLRYYIYIFWYVKKCYLHTVIPKTPFFLYLFTAVHYFAVHTLTSSVRPGT